MICCISSHTALIGITVSPNSTFLAMPPQNLTPIIAFAFLRAAILTIHSTYMPPPGIATVDILVPLKIPM